MTLVSDTYLSTDVGRTPLAPSSRCFSPPIYRFLEASPTDLRHDNSLDLNNVLAQNGSRVLAVVSLHLTSSHDFALQSVQLRPRRPRQ